jgi:hypothetical protein
MPFDQTEHWENMELMNSYQYPLSGALPLEYGKILCMAN